MCAQLQHARRGWVLGAVREPPDGGRPVVGRVRLRVGERGEPGLPPRLPDGGHRARRVQVRAFIVLLNERAFATDDGGGDIVVVVVVVGVVVVVRRHRCLLLLLLL